MYHSTLQSKDLSSLEFLEDLQKWYKVNNSFTHAFSYLKLLTIPLLELHADLEGLAQKSTSDTDQA